MQSASDLPDLLAGFARSVVTALRADACLVSLVDDDRGVLRDVAASVVPPVRLNSVAEEYDLADFPLTRWVIDTGHPAEVTRSDPTADPAEKAFLEQLGFARVLMCRFVVDGSARGTVEAYRAIDAPFRNDAAVVVNTLSSFASNAYSRIQLAEKLELHYTETMSALVSALEVRDPYTEAHAGRITDLAVALGLAMQLPAAERRALRLGTILHDVGKIGIPDAILRKPGPLDDDEWVVMRSHPELGERLLQGIDFMVPALPVIRHHHERWDGKGYPDGLSGKDIPVGARIVAVCDAFDAMTTRRPYRGPMSVTDALEEVRRCVGTQFDPTCAEILIDVVSRVGDHDLEDKFVHYMSA